MKKSIHPEYKDTTIVCACGEVIHTRSTKQGIRVDICSKCHPYFTGQEKLVDAAGMVEKFKKRYQSRQVKDKAPETKPETKGSSKPEESIQQALDKKADEIKNASQANMEGKSE